MVFFSSPLFPLYIAISSPPPFPPSFPCSYGRLFSHAGRPFYFTFCKGEDDGDLWRACAYGLINEQGCHAVTVTITLREHHASSSSSSSTASASASKLEFSGPANPPIAFGREALSSGCARGLEVSGRALRRSFLIPLSPPPEEEEEEEEERWWCFKVKLELAEN